MAGETVAAHMCGFINQEGYGVKRWPITPSRDTPTDHDALFGLFELQNKPDELLLAGVGKPSIDFKEVVAGVIQIQPPNLWSNETDDERFRKLMHQCASAVGSPTVVLAAQKKKEGYSFTLWCLDGMSPQTALFQLQEKIREQQQTDE